MPSTVASPPIPNSGGGVIEEEEPGQNHLPPAANQSPPHAEGTLPTQNSSPPPPYPAQVTDSDHATSPAVQAATSTGATHAAEAHFEPEMAALVQEVSEALALPEQQSGQ